VKVQISTTEGAAASSWILHLDLAFVEACVEVLVEVLCPPRGAPPQPPSNLPSITPSPARMLNGFALLTLHHHCGALVDLPSAHHHTSSGSAACTTFSAFPVKSPLGDVLYPSKHSFRQLSIAIDYYHSYTTRVQRCVLLRSAYEWITCRNLTKELPTEAQVRLHFPFK
jgi:hypothetical protein